MRILIVDDDATVRTILRRILTKFFDVEVTEVSNGLEALKRLAVERFGVVFLDVVMPAMSGHEVLHAIRRSPEHARLPVIAVTGTTDEDAVREMLRLGVSDYLVKPFRPARVVERLSRLLQVREEGAEHLLEFPRHQLLELTPGTRVLLVDGDAEYRDFFAKHMASRCVVSVVAQGLEALERCMTDSPYAIFIGPEIGLLRSDLLAQKVRRLPRADVIRVIGLVPPALLKRHEKRSPFHAVLPRSFVGELFDQSLEPLLRQPDPLTGVLDVVPALKVAIIAGVEQACTSLLQMEMQFHADAAPSGAKGKIAVATVHIETSDGLPPLRLNIECGLKALRQIQARALVSANATEGGALLQVAEFVGDRIVQAMAERNVLAVAHTASIRTAATTADSEPDALSLPFRSTIGNATLRLSLRAETRA